MTDLKTLSAEWVRIKASEERAVIERRKIEDLIVKKLALPERSCRC